MGIGSKEHVPGQPIVRWKGPRNINKQGVVFQEEPRKGGPNMTDEEIKALVTSMFGEQPQINPREKGNKRRHKTHRPHDI